MILARLAVALTTAWMRRTVIGKTRSELEGPRRQFFNVAISEACLFRASGFLRRHSRIFWLTKMVFFSLFNARLPNLGIQSPNLSSIKSQRSSYSLTQLCDVGVGKSTIRTPLSLWGLLGGSCCKPLLVCRADIRCDFRRRYHIIHERLLNCLELEFRQGPKKSSLQIVFSAFTPTVHVGRPGTNVLLGYAQNGCH